jgi:hypothetical protein
MTTSRLDLDRVIFDPVAIAASRAREADRIASLDASLAARPIVDRDIALAIARDAIAAANRRLDLIAARNSARDF